MLKTAAFFGCYFTLALTLGGCGSTPPDSSPPSAPDPYPIWFLEMPDSGGGAPAVGYARLYLDLEVSLAEAETDAVLSLARGRRLSIAGEHAFESVSGGTAFRGSNIRETVTPSLFASVAAGAAFLDSVVTNGMVLVLAGPAGSEVPPGLVVPGRRPVWVNKLPTAPGFHYAVGTCGSYYYESHSWQEAERRARIQLAFTRWTSLKRLSRTTGRADHQVTVEGTDVSLTGLQVVARWVDLEQGAFFVLSRCRAEP